MGNLLLEYGGKGEFSKQNIEKTGQKCEYEDREEERSDPGVKP